MTRTSTLICWLIGILIALAQLKLAAAADPKELPGLTDTTRAQNVRLRSLGLDDTKWTHGFWADRLATTREHSLPALGKIMLGSTSSDSASGSSATGQYLQNFRVAAGLAEGKHRGASFNDGDLYKWLEATAAIFSATHDSKLDNQMDEVIQVIAAAQRPDGYLQTSLLIGARQGNTQTQPFTNPLAFEAYNLGHLETAACVHYRATGKSTLLEVACKAADYLNSLLAKPTSQLARCAICPSHYMGTIELYRASGQSKYLDMARKLFELRDLVTDGTDDNQDRIPFRRQREAMGHAVRANYLYAGAADLYAETGDVSLWQTLEAVWQNVVNEKMYVTGACGALFDGASPDGSKEQSQIGRVHQAYGRDYQLPSSTAHNETCAAIGNVLWNWRMLEITGDAKYADVLELALYNAVLVGESLDGTAFFYTNTLRQLDQMPTQLRWSRTRQPYFSSFCCPPNLVRTIAEASNYAYGRTDGGVCVNLYGSNVLDTQVDGERLKLTQETNYPWDERIKITVDAAPTKPCTISLRIPNWAKDASLAIDGSLVNDVLQPGTFYSVTHAWKAGATLELKLPMSPRLIEANPLVEETRNQVAVARGPLVYCLESTDLPEGVELQEVMVARSIDLTPKFEPEFLGGIGILEGNALSIVQPKWSVQLYRDLPQQTTKPVSLKLVPYYAWGNRGPSEMSVWLPLAR